MEKVYDADGVLYFSLRQDDPVEDDVKEFLEAKSYEFYDRWPDDVPVNPWYDACVYERVKPTYRECYLELGILPKSMVYADITFHTGGETARRLEPGWASWRQVWPVDAAAKLEPSGPSDTSGHPPRSTCRTWTRPTFRTMAALRFLLPLISAAETVTLPWL